ncbi:MAG TPA: hypothetical protein VF449_01845 [Parvibaculum sp.]
MKTYITNWVLIGLGVICATLAAADILRGHHGTFDVEHLPLFYCVFGFVVYAALIFLAKALRRLILRPEDYYGRTSTDAEKEADNV